MILSTTINVEGREISEYLGIVFGETVHGINFVKDFGAGLRNVFGGRSAGYEEEIVEARNEVLSEMSKRAASLHADAIIGIQFNFVPMGTGGNMIAVNVSGTAVKLK